MIDILTCKLPEMDLKNKYVLLRVDYNIPLTYPIIYDYRLQASLPTIDYLKNQNAHIIIITHIGRPKEKDYRYSTQHLIPWFTERGYSIAFAHDVEHAALLRKNHQLILLENIRFFPEEREENLAFAQKLTHLADIYVNDAFATLHNKDTSVYLVPKFFDYAHKTIGFLVEKELNFLTKIITHPKRPLFLFLGGSKIERKLPLLKSLLNQIDALFLCPAIVFSFLAALKKPVGTSLIDQSSIAECLTVLEQARKQSVTLYMPEDFMVSQHGMKGPFHTRTQNEFSAHEQGISIGPTTLQKWLITIKNAGTIYYNGLMGDINYKESLQSNISLFQMIAHSKAVSIIAGGDSTAAVQESGLTNAMDFLSTGGGASLTYLSYQNLVGLTYLKNGTKT